MNAEAELPEVHWTQIVPGEYEWQSEHAYYKAKKNHVTGKWALGKRLLPDQPIKLIAFCDTLKAAKERAVADGVSL